MEGKEREKKEADRAQRGQEWRGRRGRDSERMWPCTAVPTGSTTEPLPVLSFILFLLYTVYSTSFVLNVVKYDSRGVVNQSIHWHIHISLGLELEEDSNLNLIHVWLEAVIDNYSDSPSFPFLWKTTFELPKSWSSHLRGVSLTFMFDLTFLKFYLPDANWYLEMIFCSPITATHKLRDKLN